MPSSPSHNKSAYVRMGCGINVDRKVDPGVSLQMHSHLGGWKEENPVKKPEKEKPGIEK